MVLVLLLAGVSALGQPTAEDRRRATQLLREGNQLANRKDYQGALEKFEQARRLYPSHKIDFNIGAIMEAAGWPSRAAEHFERFLVRLGTRSGRGVREIVLDKIRRYRESLASLKVSCNQVGTSVKANGIFRGRTPLEHRLYLEAGTYHLELAKPGYQPYAETLTLSPGIYRELSITLQPQLPGLAPTAPPARVGVQAGVVWGPVKGARPPGRPPPHRGQGAGVRPLAEAPGRRGAGDGARLGEEAPRRVSAPSASPPLYKRWWFWTLVGAVVAGAAVGGGLAASQAGGSDRVPTGEAGTIR